MATDPAKFWASRNRSTPEGKVLLVTALGFDPRCLHVFDEIRGAIGASLDVVTLRLSGARGTTGRQHLLEALFDRNLAAYGAAGVARREETVRLFNDEGHSIGGIEAATSLHRVVGAQLPNFAHVVLDISGFPRSVAFPLLGYLVKQADQGRIRNLHVAIAENPGLDELFVGIEFAHADYIQYFRPVKADAPLVWLPLLASNVSDRLARVYDQLRALCVEICPVVPFPARNLRQPDDVLLANADALEGFLVSMDNLLLCDEHSPFDVYRKVLEVDDYYTNRLASLDGMTGVKVVLSPFASKTLALGMCLAAIERQMPIISVEAGAYDVRAKRVEDVLARAGETRTVLVWLCGEPYARETVTS